MFKCTLGEAVSKFLQSSMGYRQFLTVWTMDGCNSFLFPRKNDFIYIQDSGLKSYRLIDMSNR